MNLKSNHFQISIFVIDCNYKYLIFSDLAAADSSFELRILEW